MPASRHFCASSAKALAVVAMMGTLAASGRSSERMARVASKPFITGIITSMRMASKSPGSLFSNSSTATEPSWAVVTVAPWSSMRVLAISVLSSLSSTSRMFRPSMLACPSSGRAACVGSGATSNGMVTTKVLPSPFTLLTSICPPMRSTSFFTIDMPRPVPW